MKQVYNDSAIGMSMGQTAENLAQKYNFSREMSDQFVVTTQHRWNKGIRTDNELMYQLLLKYMYLRSYPIGSVPHHSFVLQF